MESCLEIQLPSSSHGSEYVISLERESLMELGYGDFGCTHYRRRCKIRAPCCNEIFDCRHCHNEAKNAMEVDPLDRHDVPRHDILKVKINLVCSISQVQQNCSNCGVCMGKYFCAKCKFFDDTVSKNQYHCDGCGICRTGGEENFFHCNKCGCCYASSLKDSHRCVERAMHHNCPVCFEYLFDSTKDISVLPCGHTIHLDCLKEMETHFQFACPVCSKSVCDMSGVWEKLDQEVASTPMPEIYQNKMVWILCNDCGTTSEVHFHIVAHKCLSCKSYNTKQTRGGPASCSSSI
ncbi:zinc finger protein [Macleaya cordata]|uniref:Zinc finger protein n=1 Tax=Macleaya cordata TaxID=56857 RepID=A0A200R5J0_MACCD|nr:zinc finger protein [Macleaya cordata]